MPRSKPAAELYDALHYLNMKELRAEAEALGLHSKGKKASLIQGIFDFVVHRRTGQPRTIPSVCRAKSKTKYPMTQNALILKGNYKCDAKTRAFFKTLIGPHFHFTAFGIDWIEERWLDGKPPTYGEFAKMWEQEYLLRKARPATPKREWAYLNFLQRAQELNPTATRTVLMKEWKKEREAWVKQARALLQTFLLNSGRSQAAQRTP